MTTIIASAIISAITAKIVRSVSLRAISMQQPICWMPGIRMSESGTVISIIRQIQPGSCSILAVTWNALSPGMSWPTS